MVGCIIGIYFPVIIPIQGVNRTEKHVLGPQEYKNAHERWSKLVGHKCSNIMSINKICHCMALVTLQEGIPLVDANTTTVATLESEGA